MAEAPRRGIVLDAGALLAIERGELTDVLAEAWSAGLPIRFSAGAVAQAWRGGPRSARLAALLRKDVSVVPLDTPEARRVGELVARGTTSRRSRKPDIVDAHTAFIARETTSLVYTSDPHDICAHGVGQERVRRV